MEPEEPSPSQQRSPKAEPIAASNEAELSRLARDVVHQPPDPRLDRQLARMGETSESAQARSVQPTGPSAASDSELQRLDAKLGRIELILRVVIAAVLILALIEVVLLVR
ncbi:MAG: hypothetical protein ABI562_00930 [Chloroflexota bacterium]